VKYQTFQSRMVFSAAPRLNQSGDKLLEIPLPQQKSLFPTSPYTDTIGKRHAQRAWLFSSWREGYEPHQVAGLLASGVFRA
jgi:hypothetical protein